MPEEEKDKEKLDEDNDKGNAHDDGQEHNEMVTEEDKKYDDAWNDLEAAEKVSKPADSESGPAKKGLPDQEDEAKPDGKADADGKHEGDESTAKALKDTKAWATRLSMEKAALEKELKALKEGTGSAQKVADAKAAVKIATEGFDERVKKFYEDYPEAEEVLDPLIEITKNMATEFANIKKKDEARDQADKKAEDIKAALEDFTANVKPKILEVHKDFDAVVKNPEYWKWAKEQSPAMRYAAEESDDPKDITMAISEFKKYQASDETKALKEKQEKDKQNKLKNAQALRGGSMPMKHPAGSDPNDYDAGFEAAGKELEREGVR